MFFPIRTDVPLRNTPYMNWALIAANIIMFLVQKSLWPHSIGEPALTPRSPEIWLYFTSLFLHANWGHLLGNMLFLYIFGNNVNDKMGHMGYLGFYLAGGVVSGIAYVLWQTGINPPALIGASGAISAITGAYLILFPRSNITILYFFILIGTFELACFWFILAFFAVDLFYLSRAADTVAHIAHVAGTLFGCGVSYALLWSHLLPRDQFDVVALVKQWNRRRQYREAVAEGWNPYFHRVQPNPVSYDPRNPGSPPDATDSRLGRIIDLRAEIAETIAHHKLPEASRLYIELKKLDPEQVLSRQAQLDIANQLAGLQMYAEAAEAYEIFLRHYPKFEQLEQVELMLGLIYSRYLNSPQRARELLLKASARLHTDREMQMARAELAQIDAVLASRAAGT